MLSINERVQDRDEMYRRMNENNSYDLRVAAPGIIQSFDSETQTATVQLAIREKINIDGNVSNEEIPVLLDVPVFFPGGGGYSITFPINAGDECLVVFGDMCIDGWWQSGGVQNQIDKRRHDLSDGFAFVGFKSKPNAGSVGPGIHIAGSDISISSSTVTICSRVFMNHTHSGVEPGGGTTGGVV